MKIDSYLGELNETLKTYIYKVYIINIYIE